MAVVKANYRRVQSGRFRAAARAIAYYARRRDREGQLAERQGFSRDHSDLDVQAMRAEIDRAEGAYLYRMVLAPGAPSETHVDLRDWTRDTLLELERDRGEFPYVAVEHRDQTEHAHVHVVMVLDEKLTREDFARLREAGSDLFQLRRSWYALSQDPTLELERKAVGERAVDGKTCLLENGLDNPKQNHGPDLDLSLDR